MDPVDSNSYFCDPDPDPCNNANNNRRRQKISPEFHVHESSGKKSQLSKLKPIQPFPVVSPFPVLPPPEKANELQILLSKDENEMDTSLEVELISDALSIVCDGEIPESTPENASFDLVLDFMAATISEDFPRALELANTILKYEPMNETIQEFLPVLKELIELEDEESDSSCSSDSKSENNQSADSCASSHDSDSTKSGDEDSDSEEDGQRDSCEVSNDDSISTVASDEYLSEYGQEYEEPEVNDVVPPEDDGYETTTNQEEEGE